MPDPVRVSHPRDVSVCLANGEFATVVLESIRDLGGDPQVADHGTYLKLTSPQTIAIDLSDVGARLGRTVSMAEFLGWMSTYVGVVEISADVFAVSAGPLPG